MVLLKRMMAYRSQGEECWGDFFSGTGAAEAAAAAARRGGDGSVEGDVSTEDGALEPQETAPLVAP